MTMNPIIPVWLMGILCVVFLFFKKKGKRNYIRQIFIILLLFLINLRVMVRDANAPAVSLNADILFVIDNTISMLAEDYDGDGRRMDAVKNDCRYIMEQFPGASFSVATFDDSVKRLMPYTVDTNMVMDSIEVLNGQSTMYARGTSLDEVMANMENVLSSDRNTYKIVFFISDGEATNGEKLHSYGGLEQYVDNGAVLGYGTTDGGAMRPLSYIGEEGEADYLTYYDDNFDEQTALSKIDEENLKSIATDLGVDYIHMTKQSQIKEKIGQLQDEIDNLASGDGMQSKTGYADIYYIFVIPLVLLLIADYICYKKQVVMIR